MIVFGPVPSRRLGRSLGINNIPPKICTYSCIYCQLGKKSSIRSERGSFYDTEEIYRKVCSKLEEAEKKGEKVDYLSFVPDGEPVLDFQIGKTIKRLKPLGIKVAVITNASLIGDEKVREDLSHADWISLKMDTIDHKTWKKMNRPHKMILYDEILKGARLFADNFGGRLVTETMLVKDVNDEKDHISRLSSYIASLHPDTAYLSIPTRPPHVTSVSKPDREIIIQSYQVYKKSIGNVELLTGYEGNTFASTGDLREDILNITAVHPMRKEALEQILQENSGTWSMIESLLKAKSLVTVNYEKHQYYLRNI